MAIPLQISTPLPRASAGAMLSALPLTIGLALLPAFARFVRSARPAQASEPQSSEQRGALFEGTRWFEAGETDVTYQGILGSHLQGEDQITIVDPHVKSFRQIRMLGELLESLARPDGAEGHVRLVTGRPSNGLDWEIGQATALMAVKEAAAERGVHLTVDFDDTNHDRWITTSRWTIILGKGIDFWAAHTCGSRPQQDRIIGQKFAVTYCRNDRRSSTQGRRATDVPLPSRP